MPTLPQVAAAPRRGLLDASSDGRVGHDLGVRSLVFDVLVALLFAIYSAVGCAGPRFGLVALALGLVTASVGAATGWWGWVDRQLTTAPDVGVRVASLAGAVVLVVCSWALGRRLHTARLGAMALAERAERLEREQQQQVELAAAAERARIAREMHDVIAHGLSVMVVQADAAGFVLESDPVAARTALSQISATGRESMGQMRNLLGLLREGDTERAVTPGLADLGTLAEQARSAGAQVTLTVDPAATAAAVPALTALTAYRVVQEGLTNARKHGGPVVTVDVALIQGGTEGMFEGDVLQVRVVNEPADVLRTAAPASGFGLQGLAERVAAVSGNLDHVTDGDGRFVLTAVLPLG